MNRATILPIIFFAVVSFLTITAFAQDDLFNGPNNSSNHSDSKDNANQNEQMSAIDILINDHKYISKMLALLDKNLNGGNLKKSHAIFEDVKEFLLKHETMEKKVWYPELEKNKNLASIVSHLLSEEKEAAKELNKLSKKKPSREWAKEVKSLINNIQKHASEEEDTLFPSVKEVFDKTKLEEIGKKLKQFQREKKMNYSYFN